MNRSSLTSWFVVIATVAAPVRSVRAEEPEIAGVEIRIAKSVEEQDKVRAWARRAVVDGLADAKVEPVAGSARTLVVDIGGELYDFDVVVGVQADGSWVGETKKSLCECGAQELVDRVRADVTAIAPALRGEEAGVRAPIEPPQPTTSPREVDTPPPTASKKLRPLGSAGAALIAVGAASSITGLALVIVGKRDSNPRASEVEEVDYRTPGIAVLSVGLAVLIAGATMLGVERASARRRAAMTVVPSFDQRPAMIMWSGRF